MVRELWFALDVGVSSIILEFDSCSLVELVLGNMVDCSEIGLVVEEIQHLCMNFSSYSMVFGYRKVNWVAHGLAKLALASVGDSFFIDSVSPFVASFVLDNLPE
ncbi:hypothetical protein ACOSQ2_004331 [Xanthoceras sorbifolium]